MSRILTPARAICVALTAFSWYAFPRTRYLRWNSFSSWPWNASVPTPFPGHGSACIYHRRRPGNGVGTEAFHGQEENEFQRKYRVRGNAYQENAVRATQIARAGVRILDIAR